jgi:hypothetical protein
MGYINFFLAIIYSRREQQEIQEFLLEFPEDEREIIKQLCLS